ncbi:MAG: secretin N-terminal domain-containing protein [Verrucomicrobiota bacterium]
MIVSYRRILLAACLGPATVLLAQIPPQARPTNPNAVPPPGAAGFNRPRPNVPPTGGAPQRPAAAGNAANPGEERPAIRPEDAIKPGGGVELQFPNTPLSQILLVYEDLTGLKIIRDAAIEQVTVSIETTGELPKDRAIMFIEKSLLLNGYSFAPAGEGMVKILGEGKKAQAEGAPLFEAAADLPETDQVVSFVAILKYLTPDDAVKAIDQIIPRHSYGVITPVPNAKALVIVENSNTIRSILGLLERLDVKPGATVTKRIQLVRSDAEDVKKALDEILGLDEKEGGAGGAAGRPNTPSIPQPGGIPQAQLAALPAGVGAEGSTAAEVKPKILAIPRTNRLLVIAMPDTLEYIETLVAELDAASELRTFVSRTLNYLGVEAAMGIISDAIARTEGEDSGSGGSGGVNSLGQPNNSSSNNRNSSTGTSGSGTGSGGLFGNSNSSGFGSSSNGGFGSSSSSGFGSSSSGGGGFGGGGSGGGGGNLQPLRPNNGPRSLVIGKTLLISDPTANSLFASGPPEHLRVLNEILDELDRRPQQILISAVIGEVQLSKGESFGIEWLFRSRRNGTATGASSSLASRLGSGIAPLNPRLPLSLTDLATGNGFAFYGAISQNVDVIVNALDSYQNFKVISRPSVFTMNNTPALISSGQSFPIATSTQGLVGGGTNNGLLSNVQYQDVALSLNIVPLINSDDELTLQISQENSEATDNTEIAGNEYPVLSKQLLNTVVMCKNQSTVLLGGLIREGKSKDRTGVPILSNVPVLNFLTGSRGKDDARRELLIFIEPRIVRADYDLPPSAQDSPGNSSFGREVTGFMNHEKNRQSYPSKEVYSPPPVKEGRLRSLVNKLFKRDPKAEEIPFGTPELQ